MVLHMKSGLVRGAQITHKEYINGPDSHGEPDYPQPPSIWSDSCEKNCHVSFISRRQRCTRIERLTAVTDG